MLHFVITILPILVPIGLTITFFAEYRRSNIHTMAEAEAANAKIKDLSLSETKKKKDGNPKVAKKPQQQKKKIEGAALIGTYGCDVSSVCDTDRSIC